MAEEIWEIDWLDLADNLGSDHVLGAADIHADVMTSDHCPVPITPVEL